MADDTEIMQGSVLLRSDVIRENRPPVYESLSIMGKYSYGCMPSKLWFESRRLSKVYGNRRLSVRTLAYAEMLEH